MKAFLKRNGLVILGVAALAAAVPLTASMSASTTMNATADFLSAIALTNANNIAFSEVAFSAQPAAGSTVVLTTAGGATYTGVFSAGPSAAPAAGTVNIGGGSNGNVVTVSCGNGAATAVATMTDPAGTDSIQVDTFTVKDIGGTGAGSGKCTGTGTTAWTYTLAAGDLQLKFGATIEGSTATASFPGGVYSTLNPNGKTITVNVAYQ
jgi:hypothetical protein